MPNTNPGLPIVEQAGAVVYRRDNDRIHILTVRSKKDPSQRIFPKGHIESGESDIEASERELMEEAGIKGERIGFGGTREFEFRDKWYQVRYYIYRYSSTEHEGEPGRQPQFMSVQETLQILPFDDLKELLNTSLLVIGPVENLSLE